MKIDIRDNKKTTELRVIFADQKRINSDTYDFANGTAVSLSTYGGKPHLKINNGNILIEDWTNFKKAVDYILEVNSDDFLIKKAIENQK